MPFLKKEHFKTRNLFNIKYGANFLKKYFYIVFVLLRFLLVILSDLFHDFQMINLFVEENKE
jgi:hypothetical protein